jgi:exodeoxyribonuclease V gamma subunit
VTVAGDGRLRAVDAASQAHGLVIYRASRLEALLPPLQQLMAATPPRHVLTPHTLIAAHPGMRQWLGGALAREYGSGGIAANLDILLPSAWIDRLAQQELGQRAVALPGYQRQHLRWTVHAALGGEVPGVTDARIAAYLQAPADADGSGAGGAGGNGADVARRRFQLADRLARVFSQYLVYRPDWLRAWEQGRFHAATRGATDTVAAVTESQLLGPLWRHIRDRLGPHRGDIVADLLARLERAAPCAAAGETVHVFGVSHLAPAELAVLRAFARHCLVALYVPDPCREYWGGLARELPALRAQRREEEARIDAAAGNDYWAPQTHPLLAGWGRLGQHFIMALAAGDGDVLEDVRHWRDARTEPARDRLGRLQESIRQLQPQLLAVDLADEAVAATERADASLRIHDCHTRLRELEVLRDQLLDALATPDADGVALKPSDIVVMAPDIQTYVPLIPAVFGVPGDARERLPYHLADVAVAHSHGLFTAFRRWLELPGTRLTAPEVVDLLAIPEVARRLDLDAAGLDELSEWLRQSRVAWALDGPFRERFGVPPIAEHTFGWAMERMLGGYLMADAEGADRQASVTLPDGSELAPLPSIHGPAANNLGALEQLLGEVQALCDLAGKSLPASAWAPLLERRFEAFFRVDPADRAARDAQALLLRFIRSLASEPAATGEDPLLHFAVVRDLLAERLAAAPERQRFLLGGITFCGMVPQRAIPFQVVAVLGLNDGEFPRTDSDGGLDLMARCRRLGDRDVRSDDRYLFLETVMSARRRLHLSYIGQGVRDGKPRNPAAPLAELLAALDAAAGLRADDVQADRPWCVRHPLQPFDRRYFDAADPRLFSYSAAFAAMHGRAQAAAVPAFLDEAALDDAPEGARPDAAAASGAAPRTTVTLRELAGYYKDPAKQLLQQRLHLSLDALDDERLPQREPLAAQFSLLDGVTTKLFFDDGLAAGAEVLEQPPAWLRLGGLMPPGQPGVVAWEDERTAVNALLEQVRALPGFAEGIPAASRHAIDLELGAWRITGQVERVFAGRCEGVAHWCLLRPFPAGKGKLKAESDLGFKERVSLFLEWALLRLHGARSVGTVPAVRLHALIADKDRRWQDGINAWDARFMATSAQARASMLADLERRLARLLQWWQAAQAVPRWYFPKTAWASLKAELYPSSRKANTDDANTAQVQSAATRAAQAWASAHDGGGERNYAPGYNQLLAGEASFAPGTPEFAALHAFAHALHANISLGMGNVEEAP